MPSPIVRRSLVSDALSVLRNTLSSGQYKEFLLPERQLSLELGISRPTLRLALAQLEKEGLLAVKGRRGRRVLESARKPRVDNAHAIVRMLQNNTPASFLNEHLQTQEFIAEHLRGPRQEFHIETAPGCYANKPDQALEKLVKSRPASLWILYLSTEAIQQWFQSRGINCVLLGSNHPGIDFVSVDEDYSAACRHATGIFLARGHRSLAILLSEANRPGDQASREGFQLDIQQSPHADVDYQVAMHAETVPGICKAVDRLLSRHQRPTAWLIMNAQTYLTVASHLARRGVAVGREISLICRNSDPYFTALVPTVAHYERDVRRLNQRLMEIVIQHLQGVVPSRKRRLISSRYRDGDSITRIQPERSAGA